MVLWVQVEEVEEVKVDLSSVVRRVGLCSKLHVALFISIEDVGRSTEGGEDLAELVVLVWLVEAGCNFVHGGHWAAGCHVNPEG